MKNYALSYRVSQVRGGPLGLMALPGERYLTPPHIYCPVILCGSYTNALISPFSGGHGIKRCNRYPWKFRSTGIAFLSCSINSESRQGKKSK